MAKENKDKSVQNHIDQLEKKEKCLYGKGQLNASDRKRLAELKVQLDQYWDLLRQRRALQEFGQNPDKAKKRPAKIVENYEQENRFLRHAHNYYSRALRCSPANQSPHTLRYAWLLRRNQMVL